MKNYLYFAVFVLFLLFMGWRQAHLTVAAECQRLGSFYVDSQTFECKVKDKVQ